jgi:hypothetical protein
MHSEIFIAILRSCKKMQKQKGGDFGSRHNSLPICTISIAIAIFPFTTTAELLPQK